MIVRTVKNKENPYYVKARTAVVDKRLSWKAKGIHDYLMSKPDHWQANIEELAKASSDGIDAVRSGVNELITTGYMKRMRVTDSKGKVTGWRLDTYEQPDMSKPDMCFPDVAEPDVDNPMLVINETKNVLNVVSNEIEADACEASPSPTPTENLLFPLQEKELVTNKQTRRTPTPPTVPAPPSPSRNPAAAALSAKNRELLKEFEPKARPIWAAIEKQINALAAGDNPMTPEEYDYVFRALKRDPWWSNKPLTPSIVGKQAGAILPHVENQVTIELDYEW